jgi:hypothetical protein
MLTEDFKVKFLGFEPSHDVRWMVDILMTELHLKSPNKAFLSATFTLTEGIFEGVIKIRSAAGNFVAKAAGEHLPEIRQQLFSTLGSQLRDWKKRRWL